MSPNDPHLAAIRAKLTTDEERAFFDRAIARWRDTNVEPPVAELNRRALSQIAGLTLEDAVAILRSEMPRTTRTPGFRTDDPDSLTDCEGHEVGAVYDDAVYDDAVYGDTYGGNDR